MIESWCPKCQGFLIGGEHFEDRLCGTCHAVTEGRDPASNVVLATPEMVNEDLPCEPPDLRPVPLTEWERVRNEREEQE